VATGVAVFPPQAERSSEARTSRLISEIENLLLLISHPPDFPILRVFTA
jgi:hypothetical protein